jgi:hypothetical protein
MDLMRPRWSDTNEELPISMTRLPMPPDPVRQADIENVMAGHAAGDLVDEIIRTPGPVPLVDFVLRKHRSSRAWIGVVAAAVVAAAIAVPIVVTSGGGLVHPVTTHYEAGGAFVPPSKSSKPHTATGHWQLVTALKVLNGSWQQNTLGPPPGLLTCAPGGVCYVMSGKYASASAATPLSESLYVSDDLGLQWSVLPMPDGFDLSTPLSCPQTLICAVGGTLHGQPVLLDTVDGGHQWTLTPLTGVSGVLLDLVCSSATSCSGIVGPSSLGIGGGNFRPNTNLNESFVTTSDGGLQWTSRALPADDAVMNLSCPDAAHCVMAGFENNGDTLTPPSFVMVTSDGGVTWSDASFPTGFTVRIPNGMSCADDLHCVVLGTIPAPVANPPQCSSVPGPPATPKGTPPTTQVLSPSVKQIADAEGQLATEANEQEGANGYGFECSPSGTQLLSDIAVTSDGGHTWTPESLPSDVPDPQLVDISCPTAAVCWVSGSESIGITVGNAHDAGSSMLLGTTDGGTTWSKVTFSVPTGAPNFAGQEYLSMGSISCLSSDACVALGAGAQSSPTAPVYSFLSSSSS